MSEQAVPLNLYFVNVDFPPVSGPGVWRILALAKYAAKAGHRVTVFCSDRSSWHDRQDQKLLEGLPEGVRVIRIHSVFLRDVVNGIAWRRQRTGSRWLAGFLKGAQWRAECYWPDTVAHWAVKTAFAVWRLARRERPDCIVTTGPQHLAHLAGYVARQRLGVPWIMDYRDPWTGFQGDVQILPGPYQAGLMARLENRFLAAADAITVVSPDWLRLLAARGLTENGRFALVRNGHDLEAYLDATPPSLAASPGLRPCHVHFNGTVQPKSDLLPELAEAVKALVAGGMGLGRLRFSFCGLPPSFVEMTERAGIRECFVDYGPLPHGESVRRCLEADALMVTVRGEGDVQTGTIPAKTYEAVALGRHVLGLLPAQSDARDVLAEYGNATLSAGPDALEIQAALARMLAIFDAGGGCLPNADEGMRRSLAQRYSRSEQIAEFLDLARAVATGRFPEAVATAGVVS